MPRGVLGGDYKLVVVTKSYTYLHKLKGMGSCYVSKEEIVSEVLKGRIP